MIEKVASHLVMVQVCYLFFKVTHSLKIRMLDSLKLYFTYPESIFIFWNIKPFPSSLGENSINQISLAECLALIFLIQIYQRINIRVVVKGLEIWTNGEAFERQKTGGADLSRFNTYRKEILEKTIPHDNAQLLR